MKAPDRPSDHDFLRFRKAPNSARLRAFRTRFPGDRAFSRHQHAPPDVVDLAGRVSELQEYDWMDDAARQRFEELMEELKKQLLDSMFNQLQQGMSEMSPEQLARPDVLSRDRRRLNVSS